LCSPSASLSLPHPLRGKYTAGGEQDTRKIHRQAVKIPPSLEENPPKYMGKLTTIGLTRNVAAEIQENTQLAKIHI